MTSLLIHLVDGFASFTYIESRQSFREYEGVYISDTSIAILFLNKLLIILK